MRKWQHYCLMAILLAALMVVWPNLIHEPLHLLALKLQGATGTINFNWRFPAQPTTTAITAPTTIAGALFFQLLPSLFSVCLLIILMRKTRYVNEYTHFILPAYLIFDLILNVRGYASPISDFRFLQIFPPITAKILMALCIGLFFMVCVKQQESITDCFTEGKCGVQYAGKNATARKTKGTAKTIGR